MANQTMLRFGYPDTLIHEYEQWTVLLRSDHVTLGSLVLCAKADVTAFSDLPAEAFVELAAVIRDIETALTAEFPIRSHQLLDVDDGRSQRAFSRFPAL